MNAHLQIPVLQGLCCVEEQEPHPAGVRDSDEQRLLGEGKDTSILAPSHSDNIWAPRTRHEKKPVALRRKIAT